MEWPDFASMSREKLRAYLRELQVRYDGQQKIVQDCLDNMRKQIQKLLRDERLSEGFFQKQLLTLEGVSMTGHAVQSQLERILKAYELTLQKLELDLARVEESISYLKSGAVDHEFRTTVALPLHDEQSLEEMARWLLALGDGHKISRHFVQPFVDRDTVLMSGLATPGDEMLAKFVEIMGQCAEKVELRGK